MIPNHAAKALIYEFKGEISSQRAIDDEGPKIEVTISVNGSIKLFVRGGRDRVKTSIC